jgi:hypothetical protein
MWLNEKDYVYASASNQKREKIVGQQTVYMGFPCKHLRVNQICLSSWFSSPEVCLSMSLTGCVHLSEATALGSYDGCAANISIGPYADEPVGSRGAGLVVLVANKHYWPWICLTHDDGGQICVVCLRWAEQCCA